VTRRERNDLVGGGIEHRAWPNQKGAGLLLDQRREGWRDIVGSARADDQQPYAEGARCGF
jgi:hypothetical protein